MVAVDQLVQIVSGLGMVCVNVGDLRIGGAVDEVVQKICDGHTRGNSGNDHKNTGAGIDGFHHQVKTNHTEHHTAGKAQQQADGAVGILLQQRANQAAQTGTHHTGDGGGYEQCCDNTHLIPSFLII